MLLIVGLGNPGAKYANNRHNIGFMAIDEIAKQHNFSSFSKKFKSEISEGKIAGEKILLIKPQTFMNLSGEAVGQAMRFYKLGPEHIITIHDELDLAAAKVRIKTGGSAGGHNGLKSLDSHCGKEYKRLRLGIGHPGQKSRVNSHVLGDFSKADHEWLDPLLDTLAKHIGLLVEGDNAGLMNKISLTTQNVVAKTPKNTLAPSKTTTPKKQREKSHIHQARSNGPKQAEPSGPMAEMLKKLLGPKIDK